METVISVEHVSKKFKLFYDRPLTIKERLIKGSKGDYKEFYALKDVSFNIKKGSTVALIGQNGSGKSTMLKIINRTMFPDDGSIKIHGKVASLIELGAGFHPELSGRENIYTNATIFGFTKEEIDKRIPDIIKFSELEEFIDNPIRTYSSGMYARLAFAVAIHVDADILLVDEILGVGDMNFQAKCANKIYEMRKKGTTILVVTHDMSTVDRLCDYGIWLDHGKKVDEGEPRYIQSRYQEFMAGEQESRSKIENGDDRERKIVAESKKNRINISEITEFGEHYGTGDVLLTGVKVLDEKGVDKRSFQAGETIKVVVSYICQSPCESLKVNVGIEVHKKDGNYIYGTNSARDGAQPVALQSQGEIEIELKNLYLLEGTYAIGVALANQEETVNYDHYFEMVEVNFYSDKRDLGLIRLEHTFKVDGNEII